MKVRVAFIDEAETTVLLLDEFRNGWVTGEENFTFVAYPAWRIRWVIEEEA